MSPSKFDPERAAQGGAKPRPGEERPPASDGLPPGLLESVLEQTVAIGEGDQPIDPRLREAIDEVRGRYPGRPLVLVPVAQELVKAVLATEFRGRAKWTSAWEAVSKQVADTLWEDPVARSRLENLWSRTPGG